MTAGIVADFPEREDAIQARGRALLAAVEPEKLVTLTIRQSIINNPQYL